MVRSCYDLSINELPIVRYKDRIMHYAHIPKGGGTSIFRYLLQLKNVHLCFYDEQYNGMPSDYMWNLTSPQHIDGHSLARLFPVNFIDEFIAIVRDPISKIKSAYAFQRIVEGNIHDKMTIDQFIKDVLIHRHLELGWMDNHFLPQRQFLYPGVVYSIFKIELCGLINAKNHLDQTFFGRDSQIPIPHSNQSNVVMPPKLFVELTILSDESVEIIHQLYHSDYELLDYKLTDQE